MAETQARRRGVLDVIEWLGNKLPDPVFLFAGAAALVMVMSALGTWAGWEVQPLKPVVTGEMGAGGRPAVSLVPTGEPIGVRNLLSSEGLHWATTSMVSNFINFPPLGIVLVGVLGVGLAEKVGMFAALMKWLASVTPRKLLAPVVIFLGVISNITSDAGYIVLPPLAAGLFAAVGRSPVAGLACAFAGISGGFSANLIPSATDALVGGLTESAARTLDGNSSVTPVANWWFMIASTFLLTLMGWAVCSFVTEPRMAGRSPELGGPIPAGTRDVSEQNLTALERRGLRWMLVAFVGVGLVFAAAIAVPGAPLNGSIQVNPTRSVEKWTQAIIPMVFVGFVIPGIAYGVSTGALRTQKQVAAALISAIAGMAPIIVLAFFAAQFLEYLKYSNFDRMLAFLGGEVLVESGLPPIALLPAIVLVSLTINLLVSSMSAKWSMLAPILVPMLMMAGMSPELTQAAYRIGDSVTNCCTPMNSYALIILVVLERYWKSAGIGALLATMAPYTVVFAIVWTAFFVLWVSLGIPLGPGTTLWYVPPSAST
ncbi:MAG: AbgT family transporter [Phycisphaerales bacterium]